MWRVLGEPSRRKAVAALVAAGLTDRDPAGRRVRLGDDGGEPWDEAAMLRRWHAGDPVAVKVWASARADVIVTAGTRGLVADHRLPDRGDAWTDHVEGERDAPGDADLLLGIGDDERRLTGQRRRAPTMKAVRTR